MFIDYLSSLHSFVTVVELIESRRKLQFCLKKSSIVEINMDVSYVTNMGNVKKSCVPM